MIRMTLQRRTVAAIVAVLTALAVAGCDSSTLTSAVKSSSADKTTSSSTATTTKDSNAQANATKTMTVYVPMDDGRGVRSQSVTVDTSKYTLTFALNAMLQADRQQKYPVFPKTMEVTGVTVKDGVATIDVTPDFVKAANDGDLTNQLRLAAIVDTATEFSTVKGVVITVKGKQLQTYGSYDLSEPLKRMEKQIVK